MKYFFYKAINYILKIGFYLNIVLKDFFLLFLPTKNRITLSHLDIEPTNICTANCVFCAYQYQEGEFYKNININFAKKALDSFCNAGGGDIGLTPIVGDPLVSPSLVNLVHMCRSRKEIKKIGITTNGHLLTLEKFAELRNAGLTDIVISMSYPDEEEYLKIYRSNQFKKLINNLNDLLNAGKNNVTITLAIRTSRFFWKNHPLFKKAKSLGWKLSRNIYFDDWSGRVTNGVIENGLFLRPYRKKYLPCTMLQSGPHVLASGKITACGCRDLEGKSELSDESLFKPFYESNDLKKVYNSSLVKLRNSFFKGTMPKICFDCKHYNPDFKNYSFRYKIGQTYFDLVTCFKAIINFH